MPAVSFLMSNYKTPPAFLRRALDSMLSQTMPDFEAVIVNDGVKDESYEILLEYAARDERILLIENERNLGLPASLNRGLTQCSGTYIARMDTDDICLPERLALQTAYMESHPDVMFAGAWAAVYSEDENAPSKVWDYKIDSAAEYRIRLLFANDPILIHPTVIFRASFLKENGLRYSEDPRYRYSEDYEMWTRCAALGDPGILQAVVLKYRDQQTASRLTVRKEAEMAACVENVQKKLLTELGIDETEYNAALHVRLLAGRKPFDLRYKKWMSRILAANKKKKIYDQKIMRRLFRERWYHIVYYAIAYETVFSKQIRYFLSLYPAQYPVFFRDLLKKRGRSGL